MIKLAIFDMDGTLTDTMKYWENVPQEYLHTLNLKAKPDTRQKMYQMTISEVGDFFIDEYNLELTPKEIIDGINNVMLKHYREDALAKEGIIEALEVLKRKNIPMVIASTTDRQLIEASIKHTKIEKYFSKIYTTTEVGYGKHFPNIYQQAAKDFNALPNETMVFEDAYHAAKTSQNAGFITVGIKDDYCQADENTMRKLCTYYLRDWRDFNGITCI